MHPMPDTPESLVRWWDLPVTLRARYAVNPERSPVAVQHPKTGSPIDNPWVSLITAH